MARPTLYETIHSAVQEWSADQTAFARDPLAGLPPHSLPAIARRVERHVQEWFGEARDEAVELLEEEIEGLRARVQLLDAREGQTDVALLEELREAYALLGLAAHRAGGQTVFTEADRTEARTLLVEIEDNPETGEAVIRATDGNRPVGTEVARDQ